MLKGLRKFFVQFLINFLKLIFAGGVFVGILYGLASLGVFIGDKYGHLAQLFYIIFLVAMIASGLWTWFDGAFSGHADDNQF